MKTLDEIVRGYWSKNKWSTSVKLECPHCRLKDYPTIEMNKKNTGIKATCSSCGSYIKFIGHDKIVWGGVK